MNSLLLALYWHLSMTVPHALAQVFNGPGLEGGVVAAAQIEGPLHGTLREVILLLLYRVLSFLALAGVAMVIVAGAMLVISGGSDEMKEKAKKIIMYVAAGIIIILLARAFVGFFLYGLFFSW